MANSDKTIGVVGLGIMGGAFAKNLVAAGFHVIGFDFDPPARRAQPAKAGVELADDRRAWRAQAPAIITSLPNPAALHATVAEIVAAKLPKRTIIEASTFTLATSSRPSRL